MKFIRNLAVACCTLFLLCQCAAQEEVRDLSYQIRAVNKKVEDMRGSTVDQMQKRQASSTNRLDEVHNELLQLQSLFEENGYQSSQFREKTKEDLAGLHSRISRIEIDTAERIKQLEEQVDQLSTRLEQVRLVRLHEAEQKARTAAKKAAAAKRRSLAASGGIVKIIPEQRKVKLGAEQKSRHGPSSGSTFIKDTNMTATEAVTTSAVKASGDLFTLAMTKFSNKAYKEAYSLFEQVIAGNPKGDKAAETLFMMGESLYNQGEYDLAILDYQKVISNHAKHKRKPTALLRQGMSFEKLTDHETAKIIYRKLIESHPGTPEADAAAKRLKNLK